MKRQDMQKESEAQDEADFQELVFDLLGLDEDPAQQDEVIANDPGRN